MKTLSEALKRNIIRHILYLKDTHITRIYITSNRIKIPQCATMRAIGYIFYSTSVWYIHAQIEIICEVTKIKAISCNIAWFFKNSGFATMRAIWFLSVIHVCTIECTWSVSESKGVMRMPSSRALKLTPTCHVYPFKAGLNPELIQRLALYDANIQTYQVRTHFEVLDVDILLVPLYPRHI